MYKAQYKYDCGSERRTRLKLIGTSSAPVHTGTRTLYNDACAPVCARCSARVCVLSLDKACEQRLSTYAYSAVLRRRRCLLRKRRTPLGGRRPFERDVLVERTDHWPFVFFSLSNRGPAGQHGGITSAPVVDWNNNKSHIEKKRKASNPSGWHPAYVRLN